MIDSVEKSFIHIKNEFEDFVIWILPIIVLWIIMPSSEDFCVIMLKKQVTAIAFNRLKNFRTAGEETLSFQQMKHYKWIQYSICLWKNYDKGDMFPIKKKTLKY